jgi:hypothetical protein
VLKYISCLIFFIVVFHEQHVLNNICLKHKGEEGRKERFGGGSEGGNGTNKTLLTNEETFCTRNCVKVRKICRQILYNNIKQNIFNYSNLG